MTPRTLFARPSWQADAACRHEDPELFFPPPGASTERAKAICARCPVADACRAWALAPHDDLLGGGQLQGVWGGLSTQERHLLQRTGSTGRAACVDCGGPCRKTRCRACFEASALPVSA